MRTEMYLPLDKVGGGGSTLYVLIASSSTASQNGYGFTVDYSELGNDAPEASGFGVFNTLGAALHFVALAADTVSAGRKLGGEWWQIEDNFGRVAGQFTSDN